MKYTQRYLDELRVRIPEVAFEMFAERGIEAVSIQNIADKMKLGFTTMYRYYGKKSALVIEIATKKWKEIANLVEKKYKELNGENFTARQELEFYLNCYIELYKRNKPLLKFNRNFDIYVIEAKPTVEEMRPYYEAVDFFKRKFHGLFLRGIEDKTIRTDIPEETVFLGTMYSMLASAAKYACGIIYPADPTYDYTPELEMQKEAYLGFLTRT